MCSFSFRVIRVTRGYSTANFVGVCPNVLSKMPNFGGSGGNNKFMMCVKKGKRPFQTGKTGYK